MEKKKRKQSDLDKEATSTVRQKHIRNQLKNLSYIWPTKDHDQLIDEYKVIIGTVPNTTLPKPHGDANYYRHSHTPFVRHTRKSREFRSLHDLIRKETEQLASLSKKEVPYEVVPSNTVIYHPTGTIPERAEIKSQLQTRYNHFVANGSQTGLKSLSPLLQHYYLLLATSEYEHECGTLDDVVQEDIYDDSTEYEATMVHSTIWTPVEKKRFFVALERCSKGDIAEISRRIGPTKTVAEVGAYLNFLDAAAKEIYEGQDTRFAEENITYSAREMSPLFILQESIIASELEQTLEIESYAKHRDLLSTPAAEEQDKRVIEALGLIEMWNLSSLTRLMARKNDMNVLVSTAVQFTELLKHFVQDIVTELHAALLNSTDKTVTVQLMNHVIAKRQKLWVDMYSQKPDARLKEMDVMAMLDGRKNARKQFSSNRSASFLAKRRRTTWIVQDQVESVDDDEESAEFSVHVEKATEEPDVIHIRSDDSDDSADYGSDEDEMLRSVTSEDELKGFYLENDEDYQYKLDEAQQQVSRIVHDTDDEEELSEDELKVKGDDKSKNYDNSNDEESKSDSDTKEYNEATSNPSYADFASEEDIETEHKMRKLDMAHEQELARTLGFYSAKKLLIYPREYLLDEEEEFLDDETLKAIEGV